MFRVDYKAYPGTNGLPYTHYHMSPNMKEYHDLPRWMGGMGMGSTTGHD